MKEKSNYGICTVRVFEYRKQRFETFPKYQARQRLEVINTLSLPICRLVDNYGNDIVYLPLHALSLLTQNLSLFSREREPCFRCLKAFLRCRSSSPLPLLSVTLTILLYVDLRCRTLFPASLSFCQICSLAP